jgi:hypothetical protein
MDHRQQGQLLALAALLGLVAVVWIAWPFVFPATPRAEPKRGGSASASHSETVRIGMHQCDVIHLLGKPDEIDRRDLLHSAAYRAIWKTPDEARKDRLFVHFTSDDVVVGAEEWHPD